MTTTMLSGSTEQERSRVDKVHDFVAIKRSVFRKVSTSINKIKFELIIGLSPCTGREASTVYPYPAAELRGILFIVSIQ